MDINELKIKELDSLKMRESIISFPNQIDEMLEKFDFYKLKNDYSEIDSILILGMGGSAIGAEICQTLVKTVCHLPIIVSRNYVLPNWVNKRTLVIASSYSGETEETIESYNQAVLLTENIIIISTGGTLVSSGEKNKNDIFLIPQNYQPRAAIGFSLMSLLFCLVRLEIINDKVLKEIASIIKKLKYYTNSLSNIDSNNVAIALATKLYKTIPVIYGSSQITETIALRFRGQLQENSKISAFHNIVPEMNHNEIEGWKQNTNNYSIIWLQDEIDHPQIQKRMNISRKILEEMNIKNYVLKTNGSIFVERFLKLIILTDWITFYLAIKNNVDPSPVNTISKLKKMLK